MRIQKCLAERENELMTALYLVLFHFLHGLSSTQFVSFSFKMICKKYVLCTCHCSKNLKTRCILFSNIHVACIEMEEQCNAVMCMVVCSSVLVSHVLLSGFHLYK